MWENRDIRYNVLRAVGYHKGKPVAEDIIVLNGLEQAPHFDVLYQNTKPVLKGKTDIITCTVLTVEETTIQIVSVSYGCRIIPIIPVHGQRTLKN